MWRSVLLVGCAYGIVLHTVLPIIYYDLSNGSRTVLMASIDHGTCRMRNVFLSLLTDDHYPLLRDYECCSLNPSQSVALFQHYFGRPSLHKLVFPFNLLCENPNLTALIKPRLSEYRPGVVGFQLARYSIFTNEERATIVKSIIDQTLLYGDVLVVACADLNEIGAFAHDYMALMRAETNRVTISSKDDYESALQLLEHQRAKISDTIYAARRADLLVLLTWESAIPTQQKTASVCDFLESVNIDHVPEFCLSALLSWIASPRVKPCPVASPLIRASILKIQRRFPFAKSLSSDLATCVEPWENYLHKNGGHRLQIPRKPLSHDSLIKWWGGYDNLGEVLLVRRSFDHPLAFFNRRGRMMICREIGCLLDEISAILESRMLSKQASISKSYPYDLSRISTIVITAYARTLASNILYQQKVSPPLSVEIYQCLYKRNCLTTELRILQLLLTTQTSLTFFIAPDLIKPNLAPLPTRQNLIDMKTRVQWCIIGLVMLLIICFC